MAAAVPGITEQQLQVLRRLVQALGQEDSTASLVRATVSCVHMSLLLGGFGCRSLGGWYLCSCVSCVHVCLCACMHVVMRCMLWCVCVSMYLCMCVVCTCVWDHT